MCILLELEEEDFILLLVLPKPLLCFLGPFNPVADHHTRNCPDNRLASSLLLSRWLGGSLGGVFARAMQMRRVCSQPFEHH